MGHRVCVFSRAPGHGQEHTRHPRVWTIRNGDEGQRGVETFTRSGDTPGSEGGEQCTGVSVV